LSEQKQDNNAIGCLVRLLRSDPEPKVRVAAAAGLTTSRPPAAGTLAKALRDDDVAVRRQAANTLRELGDPSLPPRFVKQVAAAAVPALADRVADNHWVADTDPFSSSSKTAAIEALRVFDKARATDALEEAATKSTVTAVRAWACTQLGEQKGEQAKHPQAVACLAGVLAGDKESTVRVAAAAALASSRPPAVQALVKALRDADVAVRRQAANTLRELGNPSLPPSLVKMTEAAVPALIDRVADEHWVADVDPFSSSSKKAALEALKVLGKDQVAVALLKALGSPNESVRRWACVELGELKDKGALEALREKAARDPSEEVRKAAAAALGKGR
jgi:HEAT repeat protein